MKQRRCLLSASTGVVLLLSSRWASASTPDSVSFRRFFLLIDGTISAQKDAPGVAGGVPFMCSAAPYGAARSAAAAAAVVILGVAAAAAVAAPEQAQDDDGDDDPAAAAAEAGVLIAHKNVTSYENWTRRSHSIV